MRPEKLTEDEITAGLLKLPEWERENAVIHRVFVRPSFADAIAFVVQIGFAAEARDHHPDIDIRHRRVTVSLTTHDAGGLTELDLALAEKIDTIA